MSRNTELIEQLLLAGIAPGQETVGLGTCFIKHYHPKYPNGRWSDIHRCYRLYDVWRYASTMCALFPEVVVWGLGGEILLHVVLGKLIVPEPVGEVQDLALWFEDRHHDDALLLYEGYERQEELVRPRMDLTAQDVEDLIRGNRELLAMFKAKDAES